MVLLTQSAKRWVKGSFERKAVERSAVQPDDFDVRQERLELVKLAAVTQSLANAKTPDCDAAYAVVRLLWAEESVVVKASKETGTQLTKSFATLVVPIYGKKRRPQSDRIMLPVLKDQERANLEILDGHRLSQRLPIL